MSELPDLTAAELLAAYKTLALSPVEVTAAVLARIEAWDATLNALWTVEAAAAMAAAREAETRWAAGEPAGSLRRSRYAQGEHRNQGHQHTHGHGRHRPGTRVRGLAGGR